MSTFFLVSQEKEWSEFPTGTSFPENRNRKMSRIMEVQRNVQGYSEICVEEADHFRLWFAISIICSPMRMWP